MVLLLPIPLKKAFAFVDRREPSITNKFFREYPWDSQYFAISRFNEPSLKGVSLLKSGSINLVPNINIKTDTPVTLDKTKTTEQYLNDLFLRHPQNKELYDYLNHGAVDTDVRIANVKGKNSIVSIKEKYLNNKIIIGRDNDGQWMITKIDYECPERPSTIKFENYGEFEKCLRTLHLK